MDDSLKAAEDMQSLKAIIKRNAFPTFSHSCLLYSIERAWLGGNSSDL